MTPQLSNCHAYDTLVVMFTVTDVLGFDSADGTLAYRDSGGVGTPVVLLHAGFTDFTMFDPQLSALGRHYRVITPDARGHGASANAAKPFRQVDDLAALLRHLNVNSAVLVGVSMGAMIAIDAAIEYPELVDGLVVSGRGIGEPEFRDRWSREVATIQEDALARRDVAAWMDAFVCWAAGPDRALDEVDPGVLAKLRRMAARTLAKHTVPEPDHSIAVADVMTRAQAIRCPVLALDGVYDSPGLIATVDRLLDAVPNGRRTMIDDAGHYPNMEQPQVYNRLVAEFLDTVTSTSCGASSATSPQQTASNEMADRTAG
ncbi:alpha/beta hydrolase [Nocardia sp. NPDC050712]|uniref:alpha/beta fold hydrolase n=1 Tax=Nocardia sp. NPDC050712 TaxID=3155518 RepID=UPI003403CD91